MNFIYVNAFEVIVSQADRRHRNYSYIPCRFVGGQTFMVTPLAALKLCLLQVRHVSLLWFLTLIIIVNMAAKSQSRG